VGYKVTITLEGLDKVVSNLKDIGKKGRENVEKITQETGKDALDVMKGATHVRSGRLKQGDTLEGSGLSFTLSNAVKYAPFIEYGHMTARGWHTRHGYRPAKRRSHVPAYPFLKPAVEFIVEELPDRLSKFLED